MIKLRSFNNSDVSLLVSYLNNDELTKYITDAIPQPYTKADAHWWVDNKKNCCYTKAIEFNGCFVGCISAEPGSFEYSYGAELGYWVTQELWNKGIATVAVKAFCHYLYQTTTLKRLFVSVVADNKASIKVLQKNNFVIEGLLKQASYKNEQFYDEYLLAKLKIKV